LAILVVKHGGKFHSVRWLWYCDDSSACLERRTYGLNIIKVHNTLSTLLKCSADRNQNCCILGRLELCRCACIDWTSSYGECSGEMLASCDNPMIQIGPL
jgi:hypothetical protein